LTYYAILTYYDILTYGVDFHWTTSVKMYNY